MGLEFSHYAVEESEETWGVEDDDPTDPNLVTIEVFLFTILHMVLFGVQHF